MRSTPMPNAKPVSPAAPPHGSRRSPPSRTAADAPFRRPGSRASRCLCRYGSCREGFAATLEAAHVDFGARLDERKITGTQPDLRLRAEDLAREKREHALEVAHLTPRSTHRPSIWWNIGEWVASLSRAINRARRRACAPATSARASRASAPTRYACEARRPGPGKTCPACRARDGRREY